MVGSSRRVSDPSRAPDLGPALENAGSLTPRLRVAVVRTGGRPHALSYRHRAVRGVGRQLVAHRASRRSRRSHQPIVEESAMPFIKPRTRGKQPSSVGVPPGATRARSSVQFVRRAGNRRGDALRSIGLRILVEARALVIVTLAARRRTVAHTNLSRAAGRCILRLDCGTRARHLSRKRVRVRDAQVHHAVLRRVASAVPRHDRRVSQAAARADSFAPALPT